MNVMVNGERREVAAETTVAGLLEMLGLGAEATVVQLNTGIVDRTRFADTPISEGDALELVRFVGGG